MWIKIQDEIRNRGYTQPQLFHLKALRVLTSPSSSMRWVSISRERTRVTKRASQNNMLRFGTGVWQISGPEPLFVSGSSIAKSIFFHFRLWDCLRSTRGKKAEVSMSRAEVIRVRPHHYMHVRDTNTGIVSLIEGPTKFTALDNHEGSWPHVVFSPFP